MGQRVNYGFVQFSSIPELPGIDGTPKVLESKDKMDTTTSYKKKDPNFPSILSCQRLCVFKGGQRKIFCILDRKKE